MKNETGNVGLFEDHDSFIPLNRISLLTFDNNEIRKVEDYVLLKGLDQKKE